MDGRKAIIWDLDGVWYNYHALPNGVFYDLCDEVAAKAAMRLVPGLARQEATRRALESYEKHQDCYGGFLDLVPHTGLSEEEFRLKLFKTYHAELFETLLQKHPGFFDHVEVADIFGKLPGIRHGILSHSCMEGWGTPILNHIGILSSFMPGAMWGLDDYGFDRKHEDTSALKKMLALMGVEPANAWFVEDSLRNLKRAKEDLPDLGTAYIHYGRAPETLPSFVDADFYSPREFMQHVHGVESARRLRLGEKKTGII